MNEEAIKLLERIAKNTDHETSFQVIVSGNKSSFNTLFNPKIELDREKVYEIALVNLETYYSFLILMILTTFSSTPTIRGKPGQK